MVKLSSHWEARVPSLAAVTLDKKDLRIVQDLHISARKTLRELGRVTNLSKKSVAHHINRLEERGIITGYHVFINLFKLGYRLYQIYLSCEGTVAQNQVYIQRVQKLPFVLQIIHLQSKRGFLLRVAAQDNVDQIMSVLTQDMIIKEFTIAEINKISIKSLDIYGKNVENEPTIITRQDAKIVLDSVGRKILLELTHNARASILELQRKTNLSYTVISYRKKIFSQEEVIVKYFAAFNNYLLGYSNCYILQITLFDLNLKERIFHYLEILPNTTGILETYSAQALTSFLFFKNTQELIEFEDKLKEEFPQITHYEFILIKEQPHYKFLPY